MAVKIRLKKMGSKKRPFFRVVAADSRSPRDGRFIENLGYYNPLSDPPDIKLDDDKVYEWLGKGAIPTENAANILRKAGLLEKWQLVKQGVKISELDARIEERREKQPRPEVKKEVAREEAAPSEGVVEEEAAVEESAPAGEVTTEGEVEGESREVQPVEKPGVGKKPEVGEKPGEESKIEVESKSGEEAEPDPGTAPDSEADPAEEKRKE